MNDSETNARERGRTAGRDTGAFAGECPYPHTQLVLRSAWMTGFGEGRDQVTVREGAEKVAERGESKSQPR